MPENHLYYGDNLDVLRRYVRDESVDLIYLDPPFNSRQDYNVLFAEKDGSRSSSQINWVAAASFSECPDCRFLSRDLKLIRLAEPCPNCGTSGRPRRLYPDFSSIRFLEMITHFYARAHDCRDSTQEQLARAVQERVGRRFDRNAAVCAAWEVQELYRTLGGSQEQFAKILAAIRQRLSLSSLEEAQQAFVPLFQYSDTNEEHQVVVLLTAAMLEKLFRELLVRMSIVMLGREEARQELKKKKYQNHLGREHLFKQLARETLEQSISKIAMDFHVRWKETRDHRNDFLHGLPFAIQLSDAEKAFELSKRAFTVFAEMQNRFCATK
jgi:hypothetical protein